MRVALVIAEGVEQIVLTPETDLEKTLLAKLDQREMTISRGSFYECRGGWMKYGVGDESTFIRLGSPRWYDAEA